VVDAFQVDILKHAMIFYSTYSMDFGIKYITFCACDWLLFVFFYLYILYEMHYFFNYLDMLRCM